VSTHARGAGKEAPYLANLRVHALRHTIGMRLREAALRESTVSNILRHEHRGMTGHDFLAQIDEFVSAPEAINA